jgi:hypothetical protein
MEAPALRAKHAVAAGDACTGGDAAAVAAAAAAGAQAAHHAASDLARAADASAFELRLLSMSQPQSQDLVAQLAEPLTLAPLSQGGSQTPNGDLLASLPADGTQASQPLVADRAPAPAAGAGAAGSGGGRSKPPAARAAAVEADAKPGGATPGPGGGAAAGAQARTPGARARSSSVDPALGAAAAMVEGAEEIRTSYPVRGSDALPGGGADMMSLSDVELEALSGLQKLHPEELAAVAAGGRAAVAVGGELPESLQARLAGLAALDGGGAAMALLAGAQFPPPPPPPPHAQQQQQQAAAGGGGNGGGGGRKKPKGVHPSLKKAEHRLSRATRRGPMDEMRQLMRILTKLLTADNGVRQVLVEDQVRGRGRSREEGTAVDRAGGARARQGVKTSASSRRWEAPSRPTARAAPAPRGRGRRGYQRS